MTCGAGEVDRGNTQTVSGPVLGKFFISSFLFYYLHYSQVLTITRSTIATTMKLTMTIRQGNNNNNDSFPFQLLQVSFLSSFILLFANLQLPLCSGSGAMQACHSPLHFCLGPHPHPMVMTSHLGSHLFSHHHQHPFTPTSATTTNPLLKGDCLLSLYQLVINVHRVNINK